MANDILIKVGADISDFSRKMSESTNSLRNLNTVNSETFDSFKKVGTVAVGMGTALAVGLGGSVKVAANFESAMSSVAAISGATGKDFDLLSEKAREMGASTSFSATDAAKGLEYMALAGWDTQQMLGGIEPILHLAEAGALDLGRASDLVTDSMSALGIEVGDLDGYLDQVAKTSASANTDIDALMEAFVIAGGTFSRFNVPLEEANAFLGVMANRGFKGSEAGTALNAIMTRLTASTGPSAEALKELGISAFDSEGNFRGMEVVMKEVEAALGSLTDEERAHYQTQIAGLNHGKAFSAMLGGLGDEYDDLKVAIVDSDGALIEMRNTMQDNLQGVLANLSSAFEEIQISLGTALLPYIKMLVGLLQSAADWFNNLSDATKQKIALFTALTSTILIVGGGLALLIGFIPQIVSGFQVMRTTVSTLGLAFTGASFPMIALVATIGIVIAAVVHLWQTNEAFKNNIMIIWESIKTIITSVWEAVQPGAQAFISILAVLIGVVAQVIGWVVGAAASFATWITSIIETHSWIMTVIQVIAVVIGVIAGLVAIVMVIVTAFTVLVSIVKVVGAVILFLTSPIGIVIAVIAGLITLVVWLGEKFEWLGNILSSVSDFMSSAWDKFLGFFGAGTKEAADEASEAIAGVSEKGQEDLGNLAEGGVSATESLNEGVTSNIGSMSEETSDLLGGLSFDGIESLGNLNTEGVSAMGDMNAGVTSEIGDLSNISIDELSSLEIEGIGAISGLEDGVTSSVGGMAGDVMAQVGDMGSVAGSDFSGLANSMTENASSASTGVSSSFSDMSSTVKKEMENINTASTSGIKGLATNISKGMSNATKTIQNSMRQMTTSVQQGFSGIDRIVSTSTRRMAQSISTGFSTINRVASTGITALNRIIGTGTKQQELMFRKLMVSIVTAFRMGFNTVSNVVRSGMSQSLSVVMSASTRMVAVVRQLQPQFHSAGVHAMGGLRSGLNAGSGSVMSTARSIANRVASTVRNALKVKSPSRVFMEIGKWTSLGLAEGMIDNVHVVEIAGIRLAQAAISGISNFRFSGNNPLAKYFNAVFEDGDWANDWITHLPKNMRNSVRTMGKELSAGLKKLKTEVSSSDIDISYATPSGVRSNISSAVNGTVDVNARDDRLIGALSQIERRLGDLEVVMEGETVGRIVRPHVNEGNAVDANVRRYFD